MFAKLFNRRPVARLRRRTSTPEDTAAWAVGDIHGRLDLLSPLVDAMIADLEATTARRKILVFLGDYIDRGPDSKGVIDLLAGLRSRGMFELHFLRGNHEDRMEAFLTDPQLGPGWCDYGGREALQSYGVAPPFDKTDADGWAAACATLNAAVDDRQRAFLAAQEYSFSLGDYFFAHAGAQPGVPLDRQDPQQLMWVRQAFLHHPEPFERVVIHGHTPAEAVHADDRRIGLDTGAYATGVLTALRLEGEDRQLMQTAVVGSQVTLSRRPL
ncbi:metallophosphoesterase family protein [uncultured Brevundimonas sp.]|uniref:metallophosphoesterase family protein n=1 Tax=uncultured Brevundimonas sp. TaxID=213418 RepID=UPI0026192293|nr:metallophosphoesterase family protein [uncultured Brevundimonas sp.]